MAVGVASTSATTNAAIFASSQKILSSSSGTYVSKFKGVSLRGCNRVQRKISRVSGTITSVASVVATPAQEEVQEYALPSWAAFDLGRAPVYWKTMNGLPPMAGEKLKLFYNPAASKLVPHEDYGIAFNGGFNQPIMCGGEPRAMLKKVRGKADPPYYTIQICIPKHAVNLIFSFTNGPEWDGPYRLQFQVPKQWRNRPIDFFNKGLAEELSREGACEKAIFPDTDVVVTRCAIVGSLVAEGGDRCELNLVPGCLDPSSPLFDPNANVDDGSCVAYSDSDSDE